MESDPQRLVEEAERELLVMQNMLRSMRGEAPADSLPRPPFCSFCGRGKAEVDGMVEGIDAYICDVCVRAALHLLGKG
jgi:hypothetical protein